MIKCSHGEGRGRLTVAVITVSCCLLFAAGSVALHSCQGKGYFGPWGDIPIRDFPSPNGKYIACKLIRDEPDRKFVIILFGKNESLACDDYGRYLSPIFVCPADDAPTISWKDDHTLLVQDSPGKGESLELRSKRWRDVDIVLVPYPQ